MLLGGGGGEKPSKNIDKFPSSRKTRPLMIEDGKAI